MHRRGFLKFLGLAAPAAVVMGVPAAPSPAAPFAAGGLLRGLGAGEVPLILQQGESILPLSRAGWLSRAETTAFEDMALDLSDPAVGRLPIVDGPTGRPVEIGADPDTSPDEAAASGSRLSPG